MSDAFPTLIAGVTGAQAGIHPNELGGLLTLFAPLALVLLLRSRPWGGRLRALWILIAAGLAGFLLSILVLTQSRSALAGLAAGLAVILATWGRWGKILLAVAVVALGVAAGVLGPEAFFGTAQMGQPGAQVIGEITLASRFEIWSRATYALQDFSFTGMGLGTFRRIAPLLYPLFMIPPEKDIAHAHNLFIQSGLDLGIAGLVAFLAIWVGVFVMLARASAGKARALGMKAPDLAIGLGAGLAAHLVFGLTDAVALGARPGFLLWMAFGLAGGFFLQTREGAARSAVLNSSSRASEGATRSPRSYKSESWVPCRNLEIATARRASQ
jgi:putative inorganic carbon (HCO3(-)) transporter